MSPSSFSFLRFLLMPDSDKPVIAISLTVFTLELSLMVSIIFFWLSLMFIFTLFFTLFFTSACVSLSILWNGIVKVTLFFSILIAPLPYCETIFGKEKRASTFLSRCSSFCFCRLTWHSL